jgi:hypothetical protein
MPRARVSRRALLALSATATAAPVMRWVLRERLPLFTHARVAPTFIASLSAALDAALARAGRSTQVEPLVAESHAELERLSARAGAQSLVFAGAGWDEAWRRALSGRRVLSLDLGTEVHASPDRVSGPLAELVLRGAAFSAEHFGPRLAVLTSGTMAATDLPLVVRRGHEAAGGALVDTVVFHPRDAATAWARVASADAVAVLSSAEDAAALWAAMPARAGVWSHEGAGAPSSAHVVQGGAPLVDVLAARVVAQFAGGPTPVLEAVLVHRSERHVLPSRVAHFADLALRNRSARPFTC